MKLASLKNPNSRDGKLIVVSGDLKSAVNVEGTIPTLQEALENWHEVAPELDEVSGMLNAGQARDAFALDVKKLASPLPRAYQWLDASAYVNHVELVRKSRGVDMPASFWTDPLMYQGESDWLLGPYDDIPVADEKFGIDFEAEIAVITDDVPMGVSAADAAKHIKLIMLVNDVSLRYLAMPEIAKGFGFLQAKPATAFSPVAVTPDELGAAWQDGKVHLPLVSYYNGKEFGHPNAGVDMVFNFPTLIAHAARTRFLSAGTILGSGTVSNKNYKEVGSSCIVEKRTVEKLETGESVTPFMKFGDTVKIEMCDAKGKSIFGAIQQEDNAVRAMKLYAYYQSSASYRVRIALNLKGIKADIIPVNLLKNEQKSDTYRAINPQQIVPSLIDGEHVLTQSLAIIEYLDEKFPEIPLLPQSPPERARVRAIALGMACELAPLGNLRVRKFIQKEFGASENDWTRHWNELGLTEIEAMLVNSPGTGKFCHGATPTLADCVLVPQLFVARRFGCDLSEYPTLTRIDAACATLPAFIAAHPSNQPDAV